MRGQIDLTGLTHATGGAPETIKIADEIAEVDLRKSLLDASRWYVE